MITLCILLSSLGAACTQGTNVKISALKQMAPNAEVLAGLNSLEKSLSLAPYPYPNQIEELAQALCTAEHNLQAIVYAGDLMGRAGFHTPVIQSVALAAAKAKQELPEFKELVELAVRCLRESYAVMEVAEYAAGVDSEAELQELRRAIVKLNTIPLYATVDETINKVLGKDSILNRAAQ